MSCLHFSIRFHTTTHRYLSPLLIALLFILFFSYKSIASFSFQYNTSLSGKLGHPLSPESCTGFRHALDAIVILGQKKHSHYDSSHSTSIKTLLESLERFYPAVVYADILIFHEGNFTAEDLPARYPSQIRLCNLYNFAGVWGPRRSDISSTSAHKNSNHPIVSKNGFSEGYNNMCRFFGITMWQALKQLRYQWVARFDDDSEILSTIHYNIFDYMRLNNKFYGFRMYSMECGKDHFEKFIHKYIEVNNINLKSLNFFNDTYCTGGGDYGIYNNFFISNVNLWFRPQVSEICFVQQLACS